MEELRVLADRDVLTGLPNTRAFEVAVSERLEAQQPFVLLVGDLDGLKRINLANGYDEGNDVIQRVADKLTHVLPSACDVARIGGDEFAVLLACETTDAASRLATRFERELEIEGARVTFGWALFPKEGTTALALYRIADERLYARKLLRGERRGVFGVVPEPLATER
jgi:diguanylate cyclase (GGDEF)-like protein